MEDLPPTTTSIWEADAPMFYDFENTSGGNSFADAWFDKHLGNNYAVQKVIKDQLIFSKFMPNA